jgi:hypothetical protein
MYKSIKLFITLLLLTLGCYTCSGNGSQEHPNPNSKPAIKNASLFIAGQLTSEQLLKNMKKSYLLQPDRRFLIAFADIYRFFTGEPIKTVKVTFNNGQWIIKYKDYKIGAVPELSDFSDFMKLLSQWVIFLNKKYPLHLSDNGYYSGKGMVVRLMDRYYTGYVSKGLKELNRLWNNGEREKTLLCDAARGIILLVDQSVDKMEMADKLTARAISLLAISKTLTECNLTVEEALLARNMGYSAHAINIVTGLSQDHPVRLYILKKYKELKKIAEQPKTTPNIKYLRLKQLADLRDFNEWARYLKSYSSDEASSLAVLKTAIDINKFSINKYLVDLFPYVVLFNLAVDTQQVDSIEFASLMAKVYLSKKIDKYNMVTRYIRKVLELDKSSMIKRLTLYTAKLDQVYKGPFLDSETARAYYESYFYSCLYIQGKFYLDSLSSVELVQYFESELGEHSDKIAKEFRQWYKNLAASKSGQRRPSDLLNDIKTLSSFGAPPVVRTFKELKKYYSFGSPELFVAAKELVHRLDSRTSSRVVLGSIAMSSLLDLKLAERLISSAVDTDPLRNGYNMVWLAGFQGDKAKLWELARSEELEPRYRIKALNYLAEDTSGLKEIMEIYEQLIKEYPKDWRVNYKYVKFLKKNKKYKKARKVALKWLSLKVPTAGLEPIVMKNAVASTYYEEGRYRQCIKYIGPVVRGQQAGTMIIAAKCLAGAKDYTNADNLFQLAMKRYPDAKKVLFAYMEYLWKTDRYGRVVELLKTWKYPLSNIDWRFEIGRRFAEIYAGQPLEKGLKAFSALAEASFRYSDLRHIPVEVDKAGNSELAFQMVSLLKGGGIGRLQLVLDGYRYLKASRGENAALSWIRKRIPLNMRNPSSMVIYRQKEYELLWKLIEDPEQGGHADYVWLLRAAAWKRKEKNLVQYKKELVEYFSKTNSSYYHRLGRLLLGLESVDNLLSVAKTPDKLCEAAYYTGLKAQSEGRYYDASDWYHIAIETGRKNMGEYRWAYDELYMWYTKGKSLSQMSKALK